ncbi:DUF1003 domain-containing protein [Patescibacteria group bacterium]|nr:DUF1003 domain-containing protein [Patescibacteria group bacterium]
MLKGKLETKLEDEFSRKTEDAPMERFQHRLIAFCGSWAFLILNLVLFSVWIVMGFHYEWLTFWVSLEAIVLAILILINENRDTESDRQRAIKDYKVDMTTARKLKEIQKEIGELRGMLERAESKQ